MESYPVDCRSAGHIIYGHVAPEAPCEAAWRRHRWCREGVLQGHSDVRGSQHDANTTYVGARAGGLARRFWGEGNASANGMPTMSMRNHSLPNNMARHRTLRRAMASASAKMPRRLCLLGLTEVYWKFSVAECADTAYVGARRPCTALLGRRARKLYARDVNAQTFAA